MNANARNAFSAGNVFAACVALVTYLATFSDTTVEDIGLLSLIPLAWFFVNVLLLYVTAPDDLRRFYPWSSDEWPRWAKWLAVCLAAVLIAHLVGFSFEADGGVPEVIDGAYVLKARGHIIRQIAPAEYTLLKGAELRLFTALWFTAFLTMALDWRFRRAHRSDSTPPFIQR